ncbi:MAG: MraY family glycosyltransferase [Patescibacteria group bacterium]|nr:MraY family glycosyltransferase [Patescibacteria group bacterium]
MITAKLIILPLLAALTVIAITPTIRKLSVRYGAIDQPGKRKVHTVPVASSGGVAIFFAFLFAVLFFNRPTPEILGFLIGATILTCFGLLDDIFDFPPATKFFGQILAALIVIYSGVRIEFITNLVTNHGTTYNLGFLSLPFTFFWIIGITNAINFIDGLDGLAAGVSGIAAWTLGVVALMTGRYDAAVLAFTLGAAAFAFLPYNFSTKRKIFMGDSGSNFLGFSLAVVSIMGMVKIAAAFSMLLPIVILAVPIFDTLFAIIRRLISGKSPFQPDAAHLHHRIVNLGFSHRQTALIIYAVSLVLAGASILSLGIAKKYAVVILVSAAAFLILGAWILGLFKADKKQTQE